MRLLSRKFFGVTLLLAIVAGYSSGLGPPPALAQPEAVSKSEVEALKGDLAKIKTELEAVRQELKAIRQFLQQRRGQPSERTPVVADVSIAGNPMLGKKDAPVTLIEFSDYQCPFCRRFFQSTLPALKTEYIKTGKVRYVFRDFPLDQIHPYARKAAEAAHCAGDQDKYWEMHDLLFENQKALQVDNLKAYAGRLGLDSSAFDGCLEKSKYAAKVQQDLKDGVTAGIRGTPGFFIGKTRSDDTIQGTLISGALPPRVFRQAIESLLREE